MLYVFHVDAGRMLKFDMNAALSSVENLKEIIERLHGLPARQIVLLVSGGEVLAPKTLVCSYSAGTDTNPIYMFYDGDEKPHPCNNVEADIDLREQVDHCLGLPATYSTVSERAKLAAHLHELAHEEENICAQLVLEQHLQQQGWAAVIANMEDLTQEYRQRSAIFFKYIDEHFKRRDEYLELLHQFNDDLEQLAQIPILPGLMENAEERFRGFDEYLENDEVFSNSQNNVSMIRRIGETISSKVPSITEGALVGGGGGGGVGDSGVEEQTTSEQDLCIEIQQNSSSNLTLLQWISAKKNHHRLTIMAQECIAGMKSISNEKLEAVRQEVQNLIALAEKDEVKEIKGLSERLSGLEKLMYELKQKVKEQKDLSIAFQQNQNRASNLGDPSVLPDLCASHRSQLIVMVGNQKVIRDIRRRISRAKDELGINLEMRIKYIRELENRMSGTDNSLLFFHQSLSRVEKHMNIIQQIHQTPNIYVQAVTEVVRRRIFSGEFVEWASTLANDFLSIHSAEILRRQEFNNSFEGHFLNTLFPGLDDMPPAFNNETLVKFDSNLPNLTKSDIETLSKYLPDITSSIHLPDMAAVIEFFTSRSGNRVSDEKVSSTNKLQSGAVGSATVQHRPIDIHAHLKDGFESETDTEEFEKVGQSANERQIMQCTITTASIATSTSENICEKNSISTSTITRETNTISTLTEVPETNTVETLTEDNLGSTRLEVEKLKSLLKSMSIISSQCLSTLKNQLELVKSDAQVSQTDLQTEIEQLKENLNRTTNEYESREKKALQRLSDDYERTISDIQKNVTSKEEELAVALREKTHMAQITTERIDNLEEERNNLQEEVIKLQQQIEALQISLKNSDLDREKAVAECRERLIHEHKTEIESLRCRFKLMTSMDRSPSDTSLEKIEKPDMIEIACHESILHQTKEDLNAEKELAIKAAVEQERSRWASATSNAGGIELYKSLIDEKEKQLDAMRQRDAILTSENNQLKLRIQALSSGDESDKFWLKEKLDHLNKDKMRLELELNVEKNKRMEMETSVAILKGTNPEVGSARTKMSSSQLVVKQGVSTDSCTKGDIVFVVWSLRHRQFTVIQDSQSLYFVHADSLPGLNLSLPDPAESDIPIPYYALGRVFDKEYCVAKKDTNRYRVSMGTKFYRIKLLPLPKPEISRAHHKRERYESASSTSSSVSRSTSTQHLIDTSAQTESPIVPSTSRDMVDSASLKERTTSFTSVAEEDDEPVSLLSERCRYISVSEAEEEDKAVNDEQTTNLEPDCAITTNNNNNQSTTTNNTITTTTISTNITTSTTSSIQQTNESSSEKDQDDSDEYRSLEAKDEEPYFPLVL